jgi:hypothetical protein
MNFSQFKNITNTRDGEVGRQLKYFWLMARRDFRFWVQLASAHASLKLVITGQVRDW